MTTLSNLNMSEQLSCVLYALKVFEEINNWTSTLE